MAEQNYSYSNESFSGCDMVATVLLPKGYLGEKQVYALGELQTISYSIHMDRSPVRSIGNINAKDYVMGPRTIAGSLVFAVFNKHFANKIMKDISETKKPGYAFLIDEIPPFDIVISAANEYGLRSRMVIYGVRLVNEGQVMSVNDVYTENTYQFVATDLEYLTDENQYTSRGTSGTGLYKIVENDVISYSNKIDYDFKKKAVTNFMKTILSCKVRTLATNTKKGIVDFWLNPITKHGFIEIIGPDTERVISVADSLDKDNKISVQLEVGAYIATWIKDINNEKSETSTVRFKINQENSVEVIEMPPPLIERISDNFIEVYSNVKSHTKIIYTDQKGNTFSIDLAGKRAKIKNLEDSKEYLIATCNDDMTVISGYAKAKTLKIGHDRYKDFLEYLNYNRKNLKNSNFDEYSETLMEARDLSFESMQDKDVVDNLLEVKSIYELKLKNTNQIDFPGLLEYQDKINKLTTSINVLSEMIHIINTLTNDKVYGYNYDVKFVEPPVLESANFSTNYLFVNYGTARVEFYRQLTNTRQFTKTIESRNFKDTGEGYLCKFEGRPDSKYYAYAINEHGFRSPKVEFYVMPYEDKAEAITQNESEEKAISYELAKVKNENSYKVETDLSDEEEKRLYTEMAKSTTLDFINAPSIESVDETSIKIFVNESLDILKENEYRLVLSNVNEALKASSNYKINISDENAFTVYEHGLKNGSNYLIWIENKDGIQVSDSVSVKFIPSEDIDELREYELNKIFVEDKINIIKKYFKEDGLLTNVVENLLKKVAGETSTTKSNVFDKVIEEIMLSITALNDIHGILYAFYKAKFDGSYFIDENYFNTAPVLDKANKKIKIEEECLVNVITINKQEMEESTTKSEIGKALSFDNESLYTVIHFMSKDLSNRAGFIIISNSNNTYKTYKMLVKIGGQ